MAESVENTEVDLDQLHARAPEPASPAVQVRKALRGKHVCPFCGTTRETDLGPCQQCSLEDTPSTRAATRSKLGPWYVLQSRNPSAPGMNFSTLLTLVQKGRVTARSVIRGPTTGQFWKHAAKVKGLSREFGLCWNCGGDVSRTARACPSCKRLQEPPLNPDVLLEIGEAADDLAEQMWAQDDPAPADLPRSRRNDRIEPPSEREAGAPRDPEANRPQPSPVDRLAARGGVRRDVSDAGRRRNGPPGIIADADEDLRVPSPLEVAVFQGSYADPRRIGGQGRRGGFFRTLFKVLSIAIFTAAVGITAWCYFDPAVAQRVREYWGQIATWAGISKPDPSRTGERGLRPTLTKDEASMRVYDLWNAGLKAEKAADYRKAVQFWEEIRTLPVEQFPADYQAKLDEARRKIPPP